MRRLVLSLLLFPALVCSAQAQQGSYSSYVPLAVGDVQTYRGEDPMTGTLPPVHTEVQRQSPSGAWFQFRDFLGQPDQWVAHHRDVVYLFDMPNGRVVPVFDFTAQVGDSWPVLLSTQFSGGTMTLAANDETVRVPAGTFDDCYRFTFTPPPSILDAGWQSIWFAPGVGVVKWTEATFGGTKRFELESATIGGVTFPQPVATGGLSVSVETDRYEYVFPAMLPVANIYATATLTITNATGTPIDLTFGSGQTFDIELVDAQGNVVWIWSANKAFIQIVTQQRLTGTLQLSDSIPLSAVDADYTVKMYLTTLGSRSFAASAPIRVRVR